MKITFSILTAIILGAMTVFATSSEDSITVEGQKTISRAKKTVALDWSTLKCVQYGGLSKTYLIKGKNGVDYRIKNKNWDCQAGAAAFQFDVKKCDCKQLYPPSSGGGSDKKDKPSCEIPLCPGTTTGGETDAGGTEGGNTDAGTDDGGSTDAGTTGADTGATDGGGTDAGATDGGATDAGTLDGGATDAGTTNGAVDAGTLNGDL